jgi:hypothetical protein
VIWTKLQGSVFFPLKNLERLIFQFSKNINAKKECERACSDFEENKKILNESTLSDY